MLSAILEGLYYSIKFLSAHMAKRLSKLILVSEKRSMSGINCGEGKFVERAKSEDELVELMATCAIQNGWNSKDLEKMPVWLLTGHIVQDANPNFWQYSSL